MFFKTKQECDHLANFLGFSLDNLRQKESRSYSKGGSIRIFLDQPRPATVAIAKRMASWLGDCGSCLLWFTEYGIWPSNENLHLYYKLRESYGDHREIGEAPGHYFLGHEIRDLATFLDLGIQFGWGGHVLSAPSWTYFFVSHDGWVLLESETEIERIVRDVESMPLQYERIVETR